MMKFDSIIKEKLEGYEGPANPKAWSELEAAMNGASTPFFGPLAAGIAATAVLTVLFTSMPDNRPSMVAEDIELSVSAHNEDAVVNTLETASFTSQDHEPQEVHKIALEPITPVEKAETIKTETEIASRNNGQNVDPIINTDVADVEGTLPEMNFSANGIQCENSSVTFNAELSKAATVTWLMEGLHVYEGLTASHQFSSAGDHNVRMVTTFDNGTEYSIEKTITIYSNPEAQFAFNISERDECFVSSVAFSGTPGMNTYKWLINGDTVGKGGDFELGLSTGLYTAGMHAINEEGCTSYQTFPVRIENGFEPYIPTSFSPTNQDGNNDVYEVVGLENAASFKIKIISASTLRVVFESSESTKWDGSINGTAERPHTLERFLMTIQITDRCGETKEFQKEITYL